MPVLQQTWDNSSFYAGSDDPAIASTVDDLKMDIAELTELCTPFGQYIEFAETLSEDQFHSLLAQVRTAHVKRTAIVKQLGNLHTFISSVLSVNSQNTNASQWKPTLQQLGAELSQAITALEIFLLRVNENFIHQLTADPVLEELSFALQHERKLKDQLLSVAEEKLITRLAVHGLQGWGNLYTGKN